MNIDLIKFFSLSDKIVSTRKYMFKDVNTTTIGATKSDYDLSAIKNSIRNIFSWRPGERILNPEFGNTLYEYLYAPINGILYENVKANLIKMINTYEPRVRIDNILVDESNDAVDNNSVPIQVIYSVPDLNIMSVRENITIQKT